MKINHRTHSDQQVKHPLRDRLITIKFVGRCINCGRNTYDSLDPEEELFGEIGIYHFANPIIAKECGHPGKPDIPCFWECHSNNGAAYKKAMELAKEKWSKV